MSYTAYAKKTPPNYFIAIKPKWQLTKNEKKILPIDNLGSIRKKSWQTDWWKLVCSPIKAFYHPNMYQSLSGKEPVKQDDHPNNISCHSCSKLTGQTKTFKSINLWGFLKAQKVGRSHTVCLQAWTEKDWQHARVFPLNHMETHLDAISNNPNMLIKHYSNYKSCMDIRHVSSRLGEKALDGSCLLASHAHI